MQTHDTTPLPEKQGAPCETRTVHTASLESQSKPANRIAIKPVTWGHKHADHTRCEHEARTSRGVFRQCRRRWVTTVSGMKVCAQHATKMLE